jgi:hypothetical protein
LTSWLDEFLGLLSSFVPKKQMPEERGITAIQNTAGNSALRIESTAKKPLVRLLHHPAKH